MKLKVGDKVAIISGKEKGKEGKIIKIFRNENRVVVEGLNMVKKHTKPSGEDQKGGIIETEASIHVSNVMIVDPKTKKPTRINQELDKKGKKIRVGNKSKEKLD